MHRRRTYIISSEQKIAEPARGVQRSQSTELSQTTGIPQTAEIPQGTEPPLARAPRKKTFSLWAALPAVVFFTFILGISLWNLLSPPRSFSPVENRMLSGIPEFSAERAASGQWMEEVEAGVSDQFLFRDQWMQLHTLLVRLTLHQDNGSVLFGKNGYLFSAEAPDTAQENTNLRTVSDWCRSVLAQTSGLRVSVLLVPTARSVLKERLPTYADAAAREEEALQLAFDILQREAPGAALIDVRSSLHAARNRRQLYYRTDHHWTTFGAYIAYRRFAISSDFQPLPASAFQWETVSNSFWGTTWSKAPSPLTAPDRICRAQPFAGALAKRVQNLEITVWPEAASPSSVQQRRSLYCDEYLSEKDQYSYFAGGNPPQLCIRTPLRNGRRLLLIKDSYANCMLPFLALHYEELWVTDLRYSHGNLFPLPSARNGEAAAGDRSAFTPDASYFTDVLLLYNIQSFSEDRNLAWLPQLLSPSESPSSAP